MDFNKKLSNTFIVSRVFALISIVSAHLYFTKAPYAVEKVYSSIGSIGVVAFVIMAAYFYNTQKYTSIWHMLSNKLYTVGLPWLFLGSVSYIYNALLSRKFSVMAYLNWMIGNGSYLYYLTVLLLLFVIFYRTNTAILISSMVVTLVSLMLTAVGVWDPIIKFLHITNYLNVLNWVGIFALGILMKRIAPEKLFAFFRKSRWIFAVAFLVAVVVICLLDIPTGYFSYIGIWLELLGVLAIFGVSTIPVLSNRLFADISNMSFTIYLIHMMVIGVFDSVFNVNVITQILAVFIVICICYVSLSICRWLIKKVKIERLVNPLFGFRNVAIKK